MRYLKIALSLLALLVGAVAGAMTGGFFGNVPPTVVGEVLAFAGFLSVLGIQPWPLSAFLSKLLSAIAGLLAGVQAIHATAVTAGANPHPWVWLTIGALAIICGQLGRSPIPHAAPAEGALAPPKSDITPSGPKT